jgi:hypothetical protein
MSADAQSGLAGLMGRLQQGACQAAQRSRPADWEFRDESSMANEWPADVFAPLATLRDVPWQDPRGPAQVITALTAALRGAPSLLTTVLYSPGAVLAQLRGSFARPGSRGDPGLADAWIALCWTAEGAWDAVTRGLPAEAGYGAGDTELLRPLAARLRFLALSEPMRWRGQEGAWWAWEPDQVFGASGVLDRTLGERSWGLVVGRCQESRRIWQQCLDSYQSHPLLSQARPAEMEAELQAVVFSEHVRHAPLVLSARPLAEQAPATAEDAAVAEEIVERHLLPRFDIASVAFLGVYDDSHRRKLTRTVAAVMTAFVGLAALACAASLEIRVATALAAACYVLIGAGVVVYGSAWAAPWLLRLPAAAAVGVIALVSILPGGWLDPPPAGWLAALALAAAACGYLVVQARNLGVAGNSLWRAVAVAAIGAAHALMVSLLGLVVVAPAFVQDGRGLTEIWQHPRYGHAGTVLLLATTWCLAVGVFSQILWDDRPITAPLAHLSWRSGRLKGWSLPPGWLGCER